LPFGAAASAKFQICLGLAKKRRGNRQEERLADLGGSTGN